MSQGDFTAEEAKQSEIALNEIMEAMPKKKIGEYIGHFNDIFLFLSAAQRNLKEETK